MVVNQIKEVSAVVRKFVWLKDKTDPPSSPQRFLKSAGKRSQLFEERTVFVGPECVLARASQDGSGQRNRFVASL